MICLLACSLATAAHGQYVPPQHLAGLDATTMQGMERSPDQGEGIGQPAPWQQQPQGMTLAQKCALASAYIKAGNCGPQGCDIGLCVALQNGCRIRSWGYRCPWAGQQ
jgi:hypothetical protein